MSSSRSRENSQYNSRFTSAALVLIALFLSGCAAAAASELDTSRMKSINEFQPAAEQATSSGVEGLLTDTDPGAAEQLTGVQVSLSGPQATTSWDERDPAQARFQLPLLYLRRQGQPTATSERTLHISLSGLPGGGQVWLEAQSTHADVSTGSPHTIATPFSLPNRACTPETPCTVEWTVDAIITASDFYPLRIKDQDGNVLWTNPHSGRPDIVMLDTWDVTLGEYSTRITYATLFPYARGNAHLDQRLAPGAVTPFMGDTFARIIQETWRTQVEVWSAGRPFHPEWDQDMMIEIIINAPPFALFDGAGMHSAAFMVDGRLYPERQLWFRSSLENFATYATLEEAYRAAFAHEFFHLLQWNTRLAAGSPTSGWRNFFIEAQAAAAVTIQYPQLELGSRDREYARSAQRFLTERQNTSYRELEAQTSDRYDAALYWRFLYESYGDVGIFHAALEEMARYLAANENGDIVQGIRPVLDATLARYPGPFRSFEESLVAFGRANYGLRLENGRCAAPDLARCGERLYDPQEMYIDPPLEAVLDLTGGDVTHAGAIPASYGADLIEVRLVPALQNQPLQVRFESVGPSVRFNVQVWQLTPGPWKPRAITEQPATLAQTADGAQVYTVSNVAPGSYDRLALIITRLDSDESTDPVGEYQITLEPAQ